MIMSEMKTLPSTINIKIEWRGMEYEGSKFIHDQGDFDDSIVTEATVVKGGNGLWTPYVFQTAKGRKRKEGLKRIAGRSIMSYFPGQQRTKEQAILICEAKLKELILPPQPTPPATDEKEGE